MELGFWTTAPNTHKDDPYCNRHGGGGNGNHSCTYCGDITKRIQNGTVSVERFHLFTRLCSQRYWAQ